MKDKKEYLSMEIELVHFQNDDVITSSPIPDSQDKNQDDIFD